MCSPSDDAPSFVPAQEALDSLSHCLPGVSAATFSYTAHPCDVVLLGPGSSQTIARIDMQGSQRQCAEHLQVPREDLYLHVQHRPFEWLWVAGKPVTAALGWRLRQQMGPKRGTGLFVDCRPLGLAGVLQTLLQGGGFGLRASRGAECAGPKWAITLCGLLRLICRLRLLRPQSAMEILSVFGWTRIRPHGALCLRRVGRLEAKTAEMMGMQRMLVLPPPPAWFTVVALRWAELV